MIIRELHATIDVEDLSKMIFLEGQLERLRMISLFLKFEKYFLYLQK